MPQEIKEADFESVIFCYQVGFTFTAIWTKPKDQWTTAIPDYLKMSFGFPTPSNFCGSGELLRADQIADVIREKIREKAELQKASGRHFEMKIQQRKERQYARGKKR
jgi:hypothetical protein